jgi:hypothetical protein
MRPFFVSQNPRSIIESGICLAAGRRDNHSVTPHPYLPTLYCLFRHWRDGVIGVENWSLLAMRDLRTDGGLGTYPLEHQRELSQDRS